MGYTDDEGHYDSHAEEQDHLANEYDRKRDEAKAMLPPNRAQHPGRQVGREIPNYDPHEEAMDMGSEPDFEAITERRQERHRPDWA